MRAAGARRAAVPVPGLDGLFEFLRAHGNDLQRPAIDLLPVVADIEAALARQQGCIYAAMSGSGPTCFGIFSGASQAAAAAAALVRIEPGWWIVPTSIEWPG
jgi:4-diphosphocytidyl-2-C-methyl-D-erythritol kinase